MIKCLADGFVGVARQLILKQAKLMMARTEGKETILPVTKPPTLIQQNKQNKRKLGAELSYFSVEPTICCLTMLGRATGALRFSC